MKKAVDDKAAAGEEEETVDQVGYSGPKVNLTLFQCMWINVEIRDCMMSFVLDGKDMSKCFVGVFLPTVKTAKVRIGAMVLEITAGISADWKPGEKGRATKRTVELVCQAVQKGVKAVSEKKNRARKYKSRRIDVEAFVNGADRENASTPL